MQGFSSQPRISMHRPPKRQPADAGWLVQQSRVLESYVIKTCVRQQCSKDTYPPDHLVEDFDSCIVLVI